MLDINLITKKIKSIGMDKLLIIAVCGVLLIILSIPSGKTSKSKTNEKQTVISADAAYIDKDKYVEETERKLETLLAGINGVGDAKVMITLKDTGEKIALKENSTENSSQKDSDSSGGTSEKTEIKENEVVVYEKDKDGLQIPYVVKINQPCVEGVAVIAQGGDNPETIMKITNIMEALFSISAHKISVIGMRK